MVSSLFAEIVAICFTSSSEEIGFAVSSIVTNAFSRHCSSPLLISIGDVPDEICLCAWFRISRAYTVEVVVPSPASAFVMAEACFTTSAPAFM